MVTRAVAVAALLAALGGCCSAGGHRWFQPGHLLAHDVCEAPIPDDISPAELEKLSQEPPQMSPQAHLSTSPCPAAWAQIDTAESQPCVKECRRQGGAPPSSGCWAICEQLGGRPQASPSIHTGCAPGTEKP
jgi:hypothetical protein